MCHKKYINEVLQRINGKRNTTRIGQWTCEKGQEEVEVVHEMTRNNG